MEENDEERRALIHKFHQIYRLLQKSSRLRCHMYFDLHGNNLIEIWEYKGGRKGSCICKVKEETETACYQRAVKLLESYSGKKIQCKSSISPYGENIRKNAGRKPALSLDKTISFPTRQT